MNGKIEGKVELPNGYYVGKWGGYIIDMTYRNIDYKLTTDTGVKGIGVWVVVEVRSQTAEFSTLNNTP